MEQAGDVVLLSFGVEERDSSNSHRKDERSKESWPLTWETTHTPFRWPVRSQWLPPTLSPSPQASRYTSAISLPALSSPLPGSVSNPCPTSRGAGCPSEALGVWGDLHFPVLPDTKENHVRECQEGGREIAGPQPSRLSGQSPGQACYFL